MILEIFLGVFLLICTVTDIKSREIKPAVLLIFGAVAVGLYIYLRPVGLFEEAMGIFIGLCFTALYFITDEKIGLGDGLLMTVTGIFLGGRQNASLIMTAMLFSAFYSVTVLITKKADRKTKFAFVPFVFASYVIRLIIMGGRLS